MPGNVEAGSSKFAMRLLTSASVMSRTELNLTTGDDKTRVNPAALMAPDQFLSCKFLAR